MKTTHLTRLYALFAVLFLAILPLHSTPAFPGKILFTQTDGSVLTLQLKGDEWIHWGQTLDNYTLLTDKAGNYVYAMPDQHGGIVPSAVLAHDPPLRTAAELAFLQDIATGLFFSTSQREIMQQYVRTMQQAERSTTPTTYSGVMKIPVILMNFADHAFTYTREDFNALFNQTGYNRNGNNGSVRDYFLASSNQRFTIEAVVLGPYTAAQSMAYYGGNDPIAGRDQNVAQLIREAVRFADAEVDMRQFVNSSGAGVGVDALYVIYAGFAESSGGGAETIWPHRFRLSPPEVVDGVYVVDYGCSSERQGTPNFPETPTIGTICHEFSHILTLPDFYDTDYDGSGGQAIHPGSWDLMAGGNHNNRGKCPPLWSAWERQSVGWLTYEEDAQLTNDVTLHPLHEQDHAIKIAVAGSNSEYFLLENRQNVGWDTYLPHHGMLIIHVDESVRGWARNCANCNPSALGYKIIAADNSASNYNQFGYTYPGYSNNHTFNNTSVPPAQTKSGNGLNKPITQIAENNSTHAITFQYNLSATGRAEVSTDSPQQRTSTSFHIAGNVLQTGGSNVSARGFVYGVLPNPTIAQHRRIDVGSGSGNFATTLTGLSSDTLYYVRAFATNASGTSYGETKTVKLPCPSAASFPYYADFENNGSLPSCWYTVIERGNSTNVWQCHDTASAFQNPFLPYGGNYAVSLSSPAEQQAKLITAPMDLSPLQRPALSFMHIQPQQQNRHDTLTVYYRTNSESTWIPLASYHNAVNAWTSCQVLLPSPSSTYEIAFHGATRNRGGIGIDNVAIIETDSARCPSVSTLNISGVNDRSAKIEGNVISNGATALAERGFCWNVSGNPSLMDMHYACGTTTATFSHIMDSLKPQTAYYVRAYARNATCVSYGDVQRVKTFCVAQEGLPLVETFEQPREESCLREEYASTETVFWQRMAGNGDGNPTAAQSGSYNYVYKSANGGHSAKLILPIMNIEGWSPTKLTFYHAQAPVANKQDELRVYYKNGSRSNWTLLASYTQPLSTWTLDSITLPTVSAEFFLAFEATSNGGGGVCLDSVKVKGFYPLPIVKTLPPSHIQDLSFVANGEVVSEGQSPIIEKGFCYALTPLPTVANNHIAVSSTSDTFSVSISNLLAYTDYYARAYATNAQGTSYGKEQIVRTAPRRIYGNTIQGRQSLCYNTTLINPLTGSVPTGGYGNYTYLWLQSADSIRWDTVEFFTQAHGQNYAPERIQSTLFFCRIVYSGAAVDTSEAVKVTVYLPTRAGNVFRTEDTVALGNSTRLELRASRGTVLQWHAKQNGQGWKVIDSINCTTNIETTPTAMGNWEYRALVQNGNCPQALSGTDLVRVVRGTNLTDVSPTEVSITIAPNPNRGIFTLQTKGLSMQKATLQVIDLYGRVVYSKEEQHLHGEEIPMDLSSLCDGQYLLLLSAAGVQEFRKLIILKHE